MTAETFVKAQLAAFAHREAAHLGGFDGMLAVACVVRNRVQAGWYGGDWMEVLNHAGETASLQPYEPAPIEVRASTFRRMLADVEDIYHGAFADTMTHGQSGQTGLYFLDSSWEGQGRVMRPWFRDKIVNDPGNHSRIGQVGTLYVYS